MTDTRRISSTVSQSASPWSWRNRRVLILSALTIALTVSMSIQPVPSPATSNWVQLGETFLGENADDFAGRSVSLSADGLTLAFGTSPMNSNNGTVTVYRWTGSTWSQKGQTITGDDFHRVGFAVDLSSDGDSLLVGAEGISSDVPGEAQLYRWNAATEAWDEEMSYGFSAGQEFGSGVAISGNGVVLAAGFPQANAPADSLETGFSRGTVSVYDTAADDGDGDFRPEIYGEEDYEDIGYNSQTFDLDDDGSTIVIGSPYNSGGVPTEERGHARVFDWDGSTWIQRGDDIDGIEAREFFGSAVAISADGNTVVIGAPENNTAGTDAGQLRVFDWNGSAWVLRGSGINGVTPDDEFGDAVAISADGNTVVGSSSRSDDNGVDSGHVRVFDWNGTSWQQRHPTITGNPGDRAGGWLATNATASIVAFSARLEDQSGAVRVYQFVNDTPPVRTKRPVGTPGIFLTVTGKVSDSQAGLPVVFGADRIRPGSGYSLTIRSEDNTQSQRVLAAGRIGANGSFEDEVKLPPLNPGRYTLVLSAHSSSGALLQLGNTITVTTDGTLGARTEERLQPSIR